MRTNQEAADFLKSEGVPGEIAEKLITAIGVTDKAFSDESLDRVVKAFKDSGPETYDQPGVEIFATGTWNGMRITEKHLDDAVASFEKTKKYLKPYIKFGHNDRQNLLAADELPRGGLLENLRKVGNKLVVDFVKMPKKVYEVVRLKAFSRVSSEFFLNFRFGNETYPWTLKAVALLGGETPAVQTLQDIIDLYAASGEAVSAYSENKDIASFEYSTEDDMKNIEELTQRNAELEGQIKTFKERAEAAEASLETTKGELKTAQENAKTFKEKAETMETKMAADAKEVRSKEIDATVKAYVQADKVTPHQGKLLSALMKQATFAEDTKVFKVEDKEFSTVDALIKEFVESKVDIVTGTKTARGSERTPEDDAAEAQVKKIQKYATENKVSFKDAMIALSGSEA